MPTDTSFWALSVALAPQPAPATVPVEVELAPGAAWFRVASRPRVELGRRRVPRAILYALAQAHLQIPRRSLSAEQLVQCAWPGDRTPHASARNRLYFAINALRELGLRDLIVRVDGGYALVEHVALRIA